MNKFIYLLAAAVIAFSFSIQESHAGLDLENQKEIDLRQVDLNQDGRVTREEIGKYIFFYFDRDGNESLDNLEFKRRREVTLLPYELGVELTVVDIDNDGKNDDIIYTTESFLQAAFVEEYEPDEDGIRATDFIDSSFIRLDSDKSKNIELDEWSKRYKKFAVIKPNFAPKAADEDEYN